MRKIFSIVAMATLMVAGMASCSNNDEIESKAPASQGMKFNVIADGTHVTRGNATSSGALQFSTFQTWGYDAEDGGIYMGTSATVGKTVSLVSSNWTYEPVQYWPVNDLNFVAIAPAAPNGVSTNTVAQDGTSKALTLTTAVALSTNVEDQDDIMFAAARAADDDTDPSDIIMGAYGRVSKDDHDGDVPLNFQHALSQIVFKGKLPTSGTVTKVTIAEITPGNIGNTGSLTFTSTGAFYGGATYISTSNPSVFTLDDGDLEGSVFEAGESGIVAGTAFDLTVSNSAANKANAWFMLPQRTAAWTPSNDSELKAGALNAAPATGAYLKIRAALEKDDVPVLEDTDPIYIPLAANWDRSKKYIYTIEFNGSAALTPITFSVTAEDWTNADPQPDQISM
jgi:hypothetical protein